MPFNCWVAFQCSMLARTKNDMNSYDDSVHEIFQIRSLYCAQLLGMSTSIGISALRVCLPANKRSATLARQRPLNALLSIRTYAFDIALIRLVSGSASADLYSQQLWKNVFLLWRATLCGPLRSLIDIKSAVLCGKIFFAWLISASSEAGFEEPSLQFCSLFFSAYIGLYLQGWIQ